MASADVSKVPGEQKAILGSMNNLFNACMPLANTPGESARACCSREQGGDVVLHTCDLFACAELMVRTKGALVV
jgi:hypothetical protein